MKVSHKGLSYGASDEKKEKNDYPHLSVTTSSPNGNRQEVSVHVGNYFM